MNKVLLVFVLSFLGMVSCSNKSSKKVEIEEQVVVNTGVEKPLSNYEVRKQLEKYFVARKNGNVEQVMPKHVQSGGEGIYCYFINRGNKSISLSLHIQYSEYNADIYELAIEGDTLIYSANRSQEGSTAMQIAEDSSFKWYNKMINEEDEVFIRKVGEQGSATLTLRRKQNNELLTKINLTKEQCVSMVNTIDYYKSLDGAKIPKKGMVNIRSF